MSKTNPTTSTYRLLNFVSRFPLQLSRFVAKMLASLVNTVKISKTSNTIQLNLQIAFPEMSAQQRERICRAAIQNELSSYFEFFSIWGSSNEKNIARIHQVYGREIFDAALAEQKGIVLVVPHFGTWEVMNAWVAQHTAMTIMYKPVKDPGADQFVRNARSREQANLVPTDESGVRQIFKALKQGGTTVILPDHTPNVGGDLVPYFGVPLASSNLSAKLIQKTKAKALLLYALRNNNDGFDMHIEAIDARIYEGTAHQGTQVIHHALEDLIRRYPEHYHWSYKRFKANAALGGLYNVPTAEALARIETLRAATKAAHDAELAAAVDPDHPH